MGGKVQTVQNPYQNTTTNTFGYQSMPGVDANKAVEDYQNYQINLDPGANERRILRDQATNNKWENAFASGIPTQLRMALQGEEQRGNQQVSDFDAQNAQYAKQGMELARKQSLLPQLTQTGGTSNGYTSQTIQTPSIWSSIIGAAGQVGSAAIMASDERLKDIKGESKEGLEQVKRLNPIVYKYKKGTGLDQETHHGLSAQEVEKVMPQAVVREHAEPDADDFGGPSDHDADNDNSPMRGIQYENITNALVNSVKELDHRTKHLAKRPKIRSVK